MTTTFVPYPVWVVVPWIVAVVGDAFVNVMPTGNGFADIGDGLKLKGVRTLPLPTSVTKGEYARPAVTTGRTGGAIAKADACEDNVVVTVTPGGPLVSCTVNTKGVGENEVTGPPLSSPAVDTPGTSLADKAMPWNGNDGAEENV